VDNDAAQSESMSTALRLETAQSRLESACSFKDIKAILSDTSNGVESICRFANSQLPAIAQIETVAGGIMNLSTLELWASDAQPSVSEFRKYSI